MIYRYKEENMMGRLDSALSLFYIEGREVEGQKDKKTGNNISVGDSSNYINGNVDFNPSNKKNDKDHKNKESTSTTEYTIYKYSNNNVGPLYESVLLNNIGYFLEIENYEIKLHKKIEQSDHLFGFLDENNSECNTENCDCKRFFAS
ncbi:hypothetical protein BH23THE1_BH23THE1_27510 [soil metagenome]